MAATPPPLPFLPPLPPPPPSPPPPRIIVNTSFPRKVVRGANLDLRPSNWNWVQCLTLPLETLQTQQFSHRPYKWIRYAIGVVIGASGNLYTTPDLSGIVVDDNAD
ncbi:hypothetical protein EDB86DRAFT_3134631 [Lactarius hatsudake]|nr:hypothetical protein EDB86DRAFT_3134631 [Lactarius hatsudake]